MARNRKFVKICHDRKILNLPYINLPNLSRQKNFETYQIEFFNSKSEPNHFQISIQKFGNSKYDFKSTKFLIFQREIKKKFRKRITLLYLLHQSNNKRKYFTAGN